jgi:hypothetical protein
MDQIELPRAVPLIYHGHRRSGRLEADAAAIKLSNLYDRNGVPRFETRARLLEEYKLADGSRIIASGVDQDSLVERWWQIGKCSRARVIALYADKFL